MFSGKRQIFVLDQCVNRRSQLSSKLLSWGVAVVQVDEMRDIAVSGGTHSLILVHSAQIDALTEALTKRMSKCPFIAYGDAASPDVVYSSLKKGAAGFITVTDQSSDIFDRVIVEQSDQLELSMNSGGGSAYIDHEHRKINNISVNLQGGDCNDIIGHTNSKSSENRVRRQNIWRRSRRKLAECGPRQGVDVRRQACGVASADARWSVA